MKPDFGSIPFTIREGWPEQLSGTSMLADEAGILLGSCLLTAERWTYLRSSTVYTIRIDDHPVTDGWVTVMPDGTKTVDEFAVSETPVIVPVHALTNARDFEDWVIHTHGALGRLLIWDDTREWWIVNEPDLELTLICAQPSALHVWDEHERHDDPESHPFDWWPYGVQPGAVEITSYLVSRFELR